MKKKFKFCNYFNIAFLDEDKLKFIKDHNISFYFLDGPEWLHNSNSQIEIAIKKLSIISKAREFIGNDKVSALTTLTKKVWNIQERL